MTGGAKDLQERLIIEFEKNLIKKISCEEEMLDKFQLPGKSEHLEEHNRIRGGFKKFATAF